MNLQCIYPGCERSVPNGDAIYRTSPKRAPFEGKCSEHVDVEVDQQLKEIVSIFEQDNKS